ncbi:MAG TPA: hypothetical protein VN974_08030 [Candidatus Dormibacteraeota bacterium]|nr:hypothetical protein [Candidatus Dormibacteraeota bacterium]
MQRKTYAFAGVLRAAGSRQRKASDPGLNLANNFGCSDHLVASPQPGAGLLANLAQCMKVSEVFLIRFRSSKQFSCFQLIVNQRTLPSVLRSRRAAVDELGFFHFSSSFLDDRRTETSILGAFLIIIASTSLSARLKFRRCDVHRTIFSVYRAMPDAAPERGDVNFLCIYWISDDAMTPFKVEAGYAVSVFATVA